MKAPLRVAFVWHMHQPPYLSPQCGEVRLPWTLVHAARDYYDLPLLASQFPRLRMSFDYSPSLLEQLRHYAEDSVRDSHLVLARKDADDLSRDERRFLLARFLRLPRATVIERTPRLRNLDLRLRDRANGGDVVDLFRPEDYRDLQTWFYLSWCGRTLRGRDPARALLEKGSEFTEAEKLALLDAVREICAEVLPLLRREVARGRHELLGSPLYHPILPLLCDTQVAEQAAPGTNLPRHRFCFPEDASEQIRRGLALQEALLGRRPTGLWPPECAVSEDCVALAAAEGVRHLVTDEEILRKSLGAAAPLAPEARYRPWQLGEVTIFFRDRQLSDLISFAYGRLPTGEAVDDLVGRLDDLAGELEPDGAVVTIALDGENAWEFYQYGGYRFLEELFSRLEGHARLRTVTLEEAAAELAPARPLSRLACGSWIDGDLGTWIGEPSKNRAWELLAETRTELARELHETPKLPDSLREHVFRAQASDWLWWMGPAHSSPDDPEFDVLFRAHLQACYGEMGIPYPQALDRPVEPRLDGAGGDPATGIGCRPPRHFVRPRLSGSSDDYFEWLAAGRCEATQGFLHRPDPTFRQVFFGNDEENLFLRVDFSGPARELLGEDRLLEIVFLAPAAVRFHVRRAGGAIVAEVYSTVPSPAPPPRAAVGTIVEAALPIEAFGLPRAAWGRLPTELFLRLVAREGEIDRFPWDANIRFVLNAVDLDDENWFV